MQKAEPLVDIPVCAVPVETIVSALKDSHQPQAQTSGDVHLTGATSDNGSENAGGPRQPKSILKPMSRENSIPKDSSLPRTKTRATQRERDLKRSTSRGRHGTPSRTPFPESSTTSSSETDDDHFIPFTTERDDVLRDPRSGANSIQKMSPSPSQGHSQWLPITNSPDAGRKTGVQGQKSSLESTSENESMFSGDDVSAGNSVSLATSVDNLSSCTDNDKYSLHEDGSNTNDVTLTLADSAEFDYVEGSLELRLEMSGGDFSPSIAQKSDVSSRPLEHEIKPASPIPHKTTLSLPAEDDHGDSDTLEPIAASGFYGVKSDIPFSSKKRKIHNRKSGQKISQMTSIWSKMPLSTSVLSPKGPPEIREDVDSSGKDGGRTPRARDVQHSANMSPTFKMRRTSLGNDTPRSHRDRRASNPIVVIEPPAVVVSNPNPEILQHRKKSWTEAGAKEKLDELFGKLNSKLKSREDSSASASPQDDMLGEQRFEPSVEMSHEQQFHTQEDDQDVEVSYEEDFEQMRTEGDSNSPEFLAPFDSSVDAIQRSHSQPVLSSRDDMSYYDQSRSIHEYIATDENGTSGKDKSNSSKESAKGKPKLPEASKGFWEIPGTPRKNKVFDGEDGTRRATHTGPDVYSGRGQGQWSENAGGVAYSCSSGQREDGMSNDSNRSTINSDSDYDAEEVDPLTCAADYDNYRDGQDVYEGGDYVENVLNTREMYQQENCSNSAGFSINPQMVKEGAVRKESMISMAASNFSTRSNQGSVSVGSGGNSGRAPPGDQELIERRVHTEEWLVEDIRLKGASPRVSSAERTSGVPSTASSVADSMSAATAGSICDIDEEDMPDGHDMGEEEMIEEYVEDAGYYDGQGFHCKEKGLFFYHNEEQGFGHSESEPEDDLKLELGFLNDSSEEDEEFYEEGSGHMGGAEFSSDKCVDGSSHHNYTDSSEDYDDYMDQNDTLMYNEQYRDDYSEESGEIPGDIIQTMDELGEDILQYLSDEMEEEGEVEEWGDEDLELPGSDRNNLNNQYPEQDGLIPNSQSLTEVEALERGLSDSDGLVFYTPNSASCGNDNPHLAESRPEGGVNACRRSELSLGSSIDPDPTHCHAVHPGVPKQFMNLEALQSPVIDRGSDGLRRRTSSEGFAEFMTDSARLREQFKEHHGHIDDKDIVHVDNMPDEHNLPDNDEFFISFEIDEAHRLSYRQYGEDEGPSPEEAFYEYLQDRSAGAISSDPDNGTVFTQESPMTSLNDSNKSSVHINHTMLNSNEDGRVGTKQNDHVILATSEDDRLEFRESTTGISSMQEDDPDEGIDFAQKQNLLSEIRTHFQSKDIKKKLVAELKHFDVKSLKPSTEAELSPTKSPEEVHTVLSPVLPSVVRRLSHEHQEEATKQEFPPNLVDVERLGQTKQDWGMKGVDSVSAVPTHNVMPIEKPETVLDPFYTTPSVVSNNPKAPILENSNIVIPTFLTPPEAKTSDIVQYDAPQVINSFILSSPQPPVPTKQEHSLTVLSANCTDPTQNQKIGDIPKSPLSVIHTGREEVTFGAVQNRPCNFGPDESQTFPAEDALSRRRSSVDSTGSKLNLSRERRRSIRSFWEQLDDEKQKKKEQEETWQRRKSDLKLKQVYRSQSLTTEDPQSVDKNEPKVSETVVIKAMSQDCGAQPNARKPPPPPVAPKPPKHTIIATSERKTDTSSLKNDHGVSVKKMAQMHESDDRAELVQTTQNRRSRRRARVNHSELAAAIMKRHKELAEQNLALAATAGNDPTSHKRPEPVDIPAHTVSDQIFSLSTRGAVEERIRDTSMHAGSSHDVRTFSHGNSGERVRDMAMHVESNHGVLAFPSVKSEETTRNMSIHADFSQDLSAFPHDKNEETVREISKEVRTDSFNFGITQATSHYVQNAGIEPDVCKDNSIQKSSHTTSNVRSEPQTFAMPSQFIAAPPPPPPPPPLEFQDTLPTPFNDSNVDMDSSTAQDSALGSASPNQKLTKTFNVPRPRFNAKSLAKSNTFLPSFARKSHIDIPNSVDLNAPSQLPGDSTLDKNHAPDAVFMGTLTSSSNASLNLGGSDTAPAAEPAHAPLKATKEMKSWVTDYLKDRIGDKSRRGVEMDSFGSRISSESTSVNTSFSANTSFYGHLPMHTHHKDPLAFELQFESTSSPRLAAAAAPAPKLSIADRINKIQEKMNTSKESIKEQEQLCPTQSQQQFASLLQNRLINVIAQENGRDEEENEREKQAKSRKPPPSAWALERRRLFGKGRGAQKSEDWGEPNSSSTPTASEQNKHATDPSTQLENLSQSLTQTDVIKMSVVRRGRKPRRHTAGGTIFDIVEKFNSPESSSTESFTPIERTRPNSPWVSKARASPQPHIVSQIVNKLANTTDSDKSGAEKPLNIQRVETLGNIRNMHSVEIGDTPASMQNQGEGQLSGVVSGTFDKSIVSELLKKVELSGDESGSTSLSNSSSFQPGSLRKNSLEGSKIAELKLKLTAESRSSSNSSLSLDPRPLSAGGDTGVRNFVTRLESPFLGTTGSDMFPRNHANSLSWKPPSATVSNFGVTSNDSESQAISERPSASLHGPASKVLAPTVAPKNKRMCNERRHTTQVNFDELREKYNRMALRREHHTPPQSKALWAVDAASSRSESFPSQSSQNDCDIETVSFGVVQSSIFSSSANNRKSAEGPLKVGSLYLKTEHSVVDDTLPAEPESPLMTSSARQPPGLSMIQASSQHSSDLNERPGANLHRAERTGIKELEHDNDTVYSPLSSARVPEAYNLPLDVVPTPDPWVSSDNFQEDVSFGELAESESSDTFDFFKKRAEIKEEFLVRQQHEIQQQQQQGVWQSQGKHLYHQEQPKQQHQQHIAHSTPIFERKANNLELPSASSQHHPENGSSIAFCPKLQPLRHNFPETIIDTRTATGHVVCRVLSEVPLEPDESGIGGSDNSLGSGSVGALERGHFSHACASDMSIPALAAHAQLLMPKTSAAVAATQGVSKREANTQDQRNLQCHSQEDSYRKSSLGVESVCSEGGAIQAYTMSSPRRASVHDMQAEHHLPNVPFPPPPLFASSSESIIISTANPTSIKPIISSSKSSSPSLSTSSVFHLPAPCSHDIQHPEVTGGDTYSSNPSPTPSTHSSTKREKGSNAFGEKEKRRRSKSKFMQEMEKKRNASEPTGRGSGSLESGKSSTRKAHLSSSDAHGGHLQNLEEDTLGQNRAIFGPSVARKKSSGAIDGLEGEVTTNTMRGYSKRFDRLWAKFDPDQPPSPMSPEEKEGSGHVHGNGNFLHGVSSNPLAVFDMSYGFRRL